jgi:hypothetical protein
MIVFFTSCASTNKVENFWGQKVEEKVEHSLVMHYVLEKDGAPFGECDLYLEKQGVSKPFIFHLPINVGSILALIPEGDYLFKSIQCKNELNAYIFTSLVSTATIKIRKNYTSYTGELIFKLNSGNYTFTVQPSNREKQHVLFRKLFSELDSRFKSNIVSAFTLKKVSEKMSSFLPQYKIGQQCAVVQGSIGSKTDLEEKTKICYLQEEQKYFFLTGLLQYEIRYSNKKNINFKKKLDANSFSSELIQCLENAIKESKTEKSVDLECIVNF